MRHGHLLKKLPSFFLPLQGFLKVNYSIPQALDVVSMYYEIYELPHSQLKSPPILFMHDLNFSHISWRRVARHLSKTGPRRVIIVDARNHGLSQHSPHHTPAHMAGDVVALMKDQRLSRITAIGMGMGGRALMTLALTQPQLVERAIFINITPAPLPKGFYLSEELFQLMLKLERSIPHGYNLSEGRRFVLAHLNKLVKEEMDLMLVIRNLLKLHSGRFAWAVNAQAILDGWRDTMSDYEQTIKGLQPYKGQVYGCRLYAAIGTAR
ncbi:protein ABHD11 [Drosophila busckii]|uniref:protein ABHD11 n=1 Tax=Drosophila busckii TaxID=30019 RepID=UPI00083ECFD6|nr:protein ABHD11 [Drosophila busckii]